MNANVQFTAFKLCVLRQLCVTEGLQNKVGCNVTLVDLHSVRVRVNA